MRLQGDKEAVAARDLLGVLELLDSLLVANFMIPLVLLILRMAVDRPVAARALLALKVIAELHITVRSALAV